MHWLAWMLLAAWLVPVPYLWWTVRRDTLVEKRTWRTGLAAILWPAVLLFVAVVAAIGTRKRMWP